ncbi:SOUL heme-binding family protein [Actinidia rufa]|uniref:SOUL heme-binding family protein n=1 Tax=Actinidia rufa TaxID=165716 RepID=A0A7J0FUY4_9ERIC|nr:SOUL heme-binding family protein [Actinidia rufa]
MLLSNPSMVTQSLAITNPNIKPMVAERSNITSTPQRRSSMSASEARFSLIVALATQTSSLSQRLLMDLATETAKYVFPQRFEARNLEEALMSVPDLETVKFTVLSRRDQYEIRKVEPYFIAETTMPGKYGFDFNGASQSFNILAEYLFEYNKGENGDDYPCPLLLEDEDKWQMSFVMPSKYGSNLPLPKDPSVRIREVPSKIVAVAAFSGFVTDEEVTRRESILRDALKNDPQFQVNEGASVEVAQYNPPFTLPFTRRNEVALEVERKSE